MYNFTISSALKAWIDHLARAGRTFRYTAAGPEEILGFLGLDDVTFIHVEGLAISPESAAGGLERARKAVNDILPGAVASAA